MKILLLSIKKSLKLKIEIIKGVNKILPKKILWCLSIVFPILWIGLFIYTTNYHTDSNIFAYVLGFLYMFLFFRFLFFSKTVLYILKTDNKIKVLFISIIITFICILSFGAKFVELYNFPKVTYTIRATGEKNQLSKGTEIWIRTININNESLDLKNLEGATGWKLKDNNLVSFKKQPNSFSFETNAKDSVSINALNHLWSGQMEVSSGEDKEIFDLYSSNINPITKTYKLAHIYPRISNLEIKRSIFYLLQGVLYLFIILSIVVFINNMYNQRKRT